MLWILLIAQIVYRGPYIVPNPYLVYGGQVYNGTASSGVAIGPYGIVYGGQIYNGMYGSPYVVVPGGYRLDLPVGIQQGR